MLFTLTLCRNCVSRIDLHLFQRFKTANSTSNSRTIFLYVLFLYTRQFKSTSYIISECSFAYVLLTYSLTISVN